MIGILIDTALNLQINLGRGSINIFRIVSVPNYKYLTLCVFFNCLKSVLSFPA